MSRFYVPAGSVKDGKISISGDEAHHILDVMRLKKSDKVLAFDGTGREYSGVIIEAHKLSLVIEIEDERQAPSAKDLVVTLIQAIPKKEKMDHIIEKATELGVSRILPVVTGRTIVKWDERKASANAERWRKMAIAAAKQCGRPDIPEIGPVEKFSNCIRTLEEGDLRLLAVLGDRTIPIKDALKGFDGRSITVAIGPEGDFTDDEVRGAEKAGFKQISLGSRVLKSDTAGLFALSAINYEFSDK